MAKKTKKEKSENTEYIEFLKTFFSSLTGRRVRHLYTIPSFGDETLILSNADEVQLMAYNDCTTCVHIIKFKTEQPWLKKFREELPTPKGAHIAYCHYPTLFTALRNKDENIEVIETPAQSLVVKTSENKEETVGIPIYNQYICTVLQYLIDGALMCDSESILNIPHQIFNIDPDKSDAGVCTQTIELGKYINNKGEHIFDKYIKSINIRLLDGLDVVSIKEFIKRIKSDVSIKLITWVDMGGHIKYGTKLETPDFDVYSSRPNMCIFPPIKIALPSK